MVLSIWATSRRNKSIEIKWNGGFATFSRSFPSIGPSANSSYSAQLIFCFQLSSNETIYAFSVPPTAGPRSARPTIWVSRIVLVVWRVMKTVWVSGTSVPSVNILTLRRTSSSPRLYS